MILTTVLQNVCLLLADSLKKILQNMYAKSPVLNC